MGLVKGQKSLTRITNGQSSSISIDIASVTLVIYLETQTCQGNTIVCFFIKPKKTDISISSVFTTTVVPSL